MAMVNCNSVIFFFLSTVAMIPALNANYTEFDKYWQHKANEAQKSAFQSYSHNPEEVTVNKQVGVDLMGKNGTRRNLGKNDGRYLAENPIDRCWRCRPDWMKNRKRLADCVIGFGCNTTGGKDGAFNCRLTQFAGPLNCKPNHPC